MAAYGIYSGPSGLGYAPYGGAQPPQYGQQQQQMGMSGLGTMNSALSQPMNQQPTNQPNYQSGGLSANGGSGGSQQYIPGYNAPTTANVAGQIYMPTAQTLNNRSNQAPTSPSLLQGLQDWQINYSDAHRPQGFAAASHYDQNMQQDFQQFNNTYGQNFVPYAYANGYDPRTTDIFGSSGVNGGSRQGPNGPSLQINTPNTMDAYGNATLGTNIDPLTGHYGSGRYLPTIDPTKNGSIDSSYLPKLDPSLNPAAYKIGQQYPNGQTAEQGQKNLVSLMARNYLSLKQYYPNLDFNQYVQMYQNNFPQQGQQQGTPQPAPQSGLNKNTFGK